MADIAAVTSIEITARDNTKPAFSSIRGGFKDLQGATSSLQAGLGALGGALSVAAFASAIKGAIDYADKLNDLSKRTGVAVETLGGLGYAAQQSGIDLDVVAKGASKLADKMADAAGGNKSAQATFDALGISIKNTDGSLKPLDKTLFEIADKFEKLADGPEKAALANDIFTGKLGGELIPLLDEGGEKLRALVQEYQNYGGVTADTAARADEFNDTLGKLQLLQGALFRELAAALLPTLQAIANILVEAKEKAGGFNQVAEIVAVTLKSLVVLGMATVEAFKAVGGAISAILDAARLWFQGAPLKAVGEALSQGFSDVGASIAATMTNIEKVWTASSSAIATTTQTNLNKARAPIKATTDEVDKLAKAFAKLEQDLEGRIAAARDLSEAERLAIKLTAAEYAKLTEGQKAYLLGLADVIDEVKNEAAAMAATAKSWLEYAETVLAADEKHDEAVRSAEEMVRQLQYETDALTMTNQEREISIRLLELERAGIVKGTEEWNRYAQAIREGVVKKENLQSSINAWQQIEQTAHDVFLDIAENGSKAFERIGASLKRWVLDLLYQLTIKKFIVNLQANVSGGGGMAGAVGGGSSGDFLNQFGLSNPFGGGFSFAGNTWGGTGGGWAADGMGPPNPGAFSQGFTGAFSNALGGAGMGFGIGSLAAQFLGNGHNSNGMTIGGTIGGAIGSIWGPIGSIVGSVIGTAIGSLFKDGGGPKSGGFAATAGVNIGAQFAGDNFRYFTPDQSDPELRKVVETTGKTFDALYSALGGKGAGGFGLAIGFDTDPEGTANNRAHVGAFVNGKQVYNYESGDDALGRDAELLQQTLELETRRALLAGLQASDLPEEIANVLNVVAAGTATNEQIDQVLQLATALKTLIDVIDRDPLADAFDAITRAGQSAYATLSDMADQFEDLIDVFDGSTEASQQIEQATVEYYNALVNVIAGIRQLRDSIDAMFRGTIEDFKLATLTDDQKKTYYQDQINSLYASLGTATDPADIERITRQINEYMRAAFGLLTPDEQASLLQTFTNFAQQVNQLAQERLAAAEAAAQERADALFTQLREVLIGAANDMKIAGADQKSAAAAMQSAANDMVRAANTPLELVLPDQPVDR